MPRYFIHIDDADGFFRDDEGFHGDSLGDALHIMKRAAGELISASLISGEPVASFTLCLDSEAGKRLVTMPFRSFMGPPTG